MGLRIHSIVTIDKHRQLLAKIDDIPRDARFQVGSIFRAATGRGAWRIGSIALMGPAPGHFEVEFVPIDPLGELLEGMVLEPVGDDVASV